MALFPLVSAITIREPKWSARCLERLNRWLACEWDPTVSPSSSAPWRFKSGFSALRVRRPSRQLPERLPDRLYPRPHVGHRDLDPQPVLTGEAVVAPRLHQLQHLRRLDR